ncbi:unnamed protein product [Rhizopus stolonifer]
MVRRSDCCSHSTKKRSPSIQQVPTSANVRPVSNLKNPNAHGRRVIKKTMEDVQELHAEKDFKYKVPSPKTRIIGLLKRLMKDADEVATDRDIDEQYSNLREKTRAVVFGHPLYLYSSYSTSAKGHVRLCN